MTMSASQHAWCRLAQQDNIGRPLPHPFLACESSAWLVHASMYPAHCSQRRTSLVLAGPSGQATFQPLAALLLQPEALQRSESDSDGSGKSAKGPVQAPCSANTGSHALRRPGESECSCCCWPSPTDAYSPQLRCSVFYCCQQGCQELGAY